MGSCCDKESQVVTNSEPLVRDGQKTNQACAMETRGGLSVPTSLVKVDMDTIPKRSILQGRFKARLQDLYDGDTMTIVVALDPTRPEHYESLVIRAMGMDCPELKGVTKEAGTAAKNEALRFLGASGVIGLPARGKTRSWFSENPTFIEVEFVPVKEKWGRYLANIYNSKREKLSEHLISKNLAKPYDGGKKDQEEWEG